MGTDRMPCLSQAPQGYWMSQATLLRFAQVYRTAPRIWGAATSLEKLNNAALVRRLLFGWFGRLAHRGTFVRVTTSHWSLIEESGSGCRHLYLTQSF